MKFYITKRQVFDDFNVPEGDRKKLRAAWYSYVKHSHFLEWIFVRVLFGAALIPLLTWAQTVTQHGLPVGMLITLAILALPMTLYDIADANRMARHMPQLLKLGDLK